MKFAEDLTFLELLLVGIHGVSDLTRVPVNFFELGHFFRFMMLLEVFFDFLFRELIKLDDLFQKILVIEFVAETFVVGEGGVDSEDDGQFLFHGGPEDFELLFGEIELKFVEFAKDLIILGYGVGTPLLMYFFVSILVFVVSSG